MVSGKVRSCCTYIPYINGGGGSGSVVYYLWPRGLYGEKEGREEEGGWYNIVKRAITYVYYVGIIYMVDACVYVGIYLSGILIYVR